MTFTTLGQERFKSDSRQIAGLLMLVSTCALIFPMADIASLVGPAGTTPNEGLGLAFLIASIIVVSVGILGIIIGYLQTIHDYGNKHLTGLFLIIIQLTWMVSSQRSVALNPTQVVIVICLTSALPHFESSMSQPFLTNLTAVGQGARSGAAFIPAEYNPSAADVKFVGAMGMMGVLGHGSGTVGSLALAGFALYAFQVGKPGDRPGSYYGGRLTFYAFALFLVGIAQFLLGIYVLVNFGTGPLPNGPIVVAMFVVNFPEISVFCGLLNVLTSIYGGARSYGMLSSKDDDSYSMLMLFGWVCNITLAVMVQVAYNPADAAAAAAPSLSMLTSAVYAINAFLDFKMRSTPNDIPADYYSEEGGTQKEGLDIVEASPDGGET
jgi:hypothetical protein